MDKKNVEVNRKKYNEIKRMDHGQMEQMVNEYYQEGFQDGMEAGRTSFDTKKAMEQIAGMRIGMAKIKAVHNALVAAGAASVSDQLEEMVKATRKAGESGGHTAEEIGGRRCTRPGSAG